VKPYWKFQTKKPINHAFKITTHENCVALSNHFLSIINQKTNRYVKQKINQTKEIHVRINSSSTSFFCIIFPNQSGVSTEKVKETETVTVITKMPRSGKDLEFSQAQSDTVKKIITVNINA
jgi:hypothetical protein